MAPHLRKLLGTSNSVFNKQFVALLPGIRWYPIPGRLSLDKHVEGLEHAPDLLDVELTRSIDEKNWTAAVPGRRLAKQSDPSSFSFRPDHEITHFGIVASDLVTKVVAVDNLEIEFLLHRRHASAVEGLGVFEDQFEDYHRSSGFPADGRRNSVEASRITRDPKGLRIGCFKS